MTALYHPPLKGIQVDFHVQYLEFCCRSLGSSLGKGFVLVSHTCCQHCLPPSLKDSLNNLKHELIKWHLLWKQLFRWSMIIWGILCLQTPLLVQKSFRPVSLVCLRVSFCPYRIYRVSARTCRRTKSGSLTSDIHLDQGKNIHKPQGAWCRNCFQEHFSLNTAANLCQTVWHITDHFHACRFLHNPSSFTFDTPITLHLRTRQSDATLSTWTWVDQEQGISDDFCIYSILLVCNKLNWHSFTYRSFGQFKHNLSVIASI